MSLVIAVEPIPLRMDPDGVVRVSGTRVTLDTIVAAFKEGASAEEIASEYYPLDLADVYAVISYYLRHRSDVDAYLQERQQQAEVVRQQNESRFDQSGLQDRLLARRTKSPDVSDASPGGGS